MARLLESEAVWVLQLKRLILKVKYGHLFVILKELVKGLLQERCREVGHSYLPLPLTASI